MARIVSRAQSDTLYGWSNAKNKGRKGDDMTLQGPYKLHMRQLKSSLNREKSAKQTQFIRLNSFALS